MTTDHDAGHDAGAKPAAEPRNRREFCDLLLGGSLGLTALAALYPAASFLVPPESGESETASVVLPFPAEELKANEGRIFKFGSTPGLVVKLNSGEIRAYNARCTHLSCIVQYAPEEQRIFCACHAGWYDLTGLNVAGPPPRPLDVYTTNLRRRRDGDGHDIVVTRA